MNEYETERIAKAVNVLRPDWPVNSLITLMGKEQLKHRPRRDVLVALCWVASESNSHTPARVLEAGPWWKATQADGDTGGGHKHPMRAGDPDECRTHRGQHRDHCSGCAADRLTRDPTPPRVPPPGDVIDEDTGRKITGRELWDIKRQELDLRHALTPSIEEEA